MGKEQLFSIHHVAHDFIEHYPFTTIFLSSLKNPGLSSCSLYRKLSLPLMISVVLLRKDVSELERAEYRTGGTRAALTQGIKTPWIYTVPSPLHFVLHILTLCNISYVF